MAYGDKFADDIIQRLTQLATARLPHERAWRQIAALAAPDAGEITSGIGVNGSAALQVLQTTAAERSKKIYDSTAVWAVDRLSSGIEAMVTPQSEYWHGYGLLDFSKEDYDLAEKQWFERLRNVMFKIRYSADTGFVNALQTCYRRLVAFGNAFMFVEDAMGTKRSMLSYLPMPIGECYAAENNMGAVDQFYRFYSLTARQAKQKFGSKLSPDIMRAAENANDSEQRFMFVHCIMPRADFGNASYGLKKAPWASYHVDYNNRRIVGEKGYFEFPVVDFRWLPEPGRVYGEGPVQKCLADIQSLNVMARNELVASEQAIKPPLLVADAGVMNRPDTSPGAVNFGGMSPNGQRRVEPLFNGQRLDFATMVKTAKQQGVKESLYINLFQVLIQNPQMSATEAMIRANEKGELLGPAGSRVQGGLSVMVERELGIVSRYGIFDQESAFKVPRSLQGGKIGPRMTSPLDRLRHAKEVEGTIRTLEIMSPIAQIDNSVVDNFDADEMARGVGEYLGMPAKFLRPLQLVQKRREAAQQAQAQAQMAAVAKDYAAAGAQGSQALVNLREAGGV